MKYIHVVITYAWSQGTSYSSDLEPIAAFEDAAAAHECIEALEHRNSSRHALEDGFGVVVCPLLENAPNPAFIYRAEVDTRGRVLDVRRRFAWTAHDASRSDRAVGYGDTVPEALAAASRAHSRAAEDTHSDEQRGGVPWYERE